MEEDSRVYLHAIYEVFREKFSRDSLPEYVVIGEALAHIINQHNPNISDEMFSRIHQNRTSLIRRFVEEYYLSYILGSFKQGCPRIRLTFPN